MDREAIPHFGTDLIAEQICQGFATVDVEIVHNQVNGFGGRVSERQIDSNFDELGRRPVRRGKSEMAAGFRFYRTKEVGRAPAFIFVVLSGLATRFGG